MEETFQLWGEKDELVLRISGHADERGSNEYNLALGDRRAYEVKKFLVGLGLNAEKVSIISFGEEKPLAKSHNEEAWKNKLSPNLLVYDNDKNIYSVVQGQKRVNLRSAVDVLIPYQHARCFYCNKKLNVNAKSNENDFPDVDHVIPFSAFNNQIFTDKINSNVIWNLVIACQECNRGNKGKFNSPPDKYYFEKLINRNILFTQEHKHSLKNTILISLGASNHQQVRQKKYWL